MGERILSKKTLSILICGIVLLQTHAWAESEGFKVAGEINFKKTGDIYVTLVTKEQFEADGDGAKEQEKEKQGVEPSPFALIIPVGKEEQKSQKVSFAFEGVPAGTYGIRCFQDVHGNGELDMGTFGPKEPWGMYRPKRPTFRGPRFKEIKFEVKEDMTDISFEVK